jgi:hypothetical protein
LNTIEQSPKLAAVLSSSAAPAVARWNSTNREKTHPKLSEACNSRHPQISRRKFVPISRYPDRWHTNRTGTTRGALRFAWPGGGQHWVGSAFLRLGRSRQGRQSKTDRRVPTEHLPRPRCLLLRRDSESISEGRHQSIIKRCVYLKIMWVGLPSVHNRRPSLSVVYNLNYALHLTA